MDLRVILARNLYGEFLCLLNGIICINLLSLIVRTMGMTESDDQKICDLLRVRDKKGLSLLFQVYYTPLVLYANVFLNNLSLAEDLVQEFFISVWEDRIYEKFHSCNLSFFIRLLVKNRALNKLKSKDVLRESLEVDYVEQAWEEYDEQHDRIVEAVRQEILLLPPRSREIMLLVFQKGMKYQEVATSLDISLSTVKNLVMKSIDKLRERLNDEVLISFFFFKQNKFKNE